MPLELHGSGVAGAARLRQQAMRDIHTDHVGSLLRPRGLLDAREAFADGTIGSAELKAAEDRAIDHVVTLQEQAGCEIITDGELRRLSFQSQILESVDGFGEWDLEAFLWGDWYGEGLEPWHRRRPADLGVVAPLRRKRHLSAEEFTYLRARTKRFAKVTLPSPSLLSSFWSPTRSREAYPTLPDFLQAVTEILRGDVEELVRLGCRYIQLDAPHYPLLIDPKVRGFYESQGWTVDEWLARGIELDNALMDSIPEVTFGFHLCRENQASRWLVSGSYERIARRIFQGIKATRLLLEYDDERSGDFQPLRHVPDDKMVVLGVVTTKTPQLERADVLKARVREAAQHVDLERLAISPQCGFATSILGNALTEKDEMAKLQLIANTAAEIWSS